MKRLLIALCLLWNTLALKAATDYTIFESVAINRQALDRILQFLDKEEVTCSWVAEYPIITDLINAMNLKRGCEVGVAYGGQSKYFLEKTTIEKLYSIDPYKNFTKNEYDDFLNFEQAMHDVLFIKVQRKLAPFGERSVLLRQTSAEAVKAFENDSLDFVYIDANHAYEYVLADLVLWFPKIKTGGLVAGDDYRVWPGVSRAVKEFTKKLNVEFKTEGNKWWFIKP